MAMLNKLTRKWISINTTKIPSTSLHSSLPPASFSLSQNYSFMIPRLRSNSKFNTKLCVSHGTSAYEYNEEEEEEEDSASFDEAVVLFNKRKYYKCHDVLESLWMKADDPSRTIIHGILQCAVGFHHLFNQNHKGAMMELGEGLCKLQKMNLDKRGSPFHQFEKDISAVLNFIYQTQIELAACRDDVCVTMDRSEKSYQLLGGYAAGQQVYTLQLDTTAALHIVFCPQGSYGSVEPPRVKLPQLNASEEHLRELNYN